jgi:glycosyltransferase involved in cell wall biosynthesis
MDTDRDSRPGETAPRIAPIPVSVVLPALNEAENITGALAALLWADEVIVVDGGSTDETVALAIEGGATVIELRDRTIGAQRNAGIAIARNEWVLAVDADERVTPALRDELARVIQAPTQDVYAIPFRNFYLGQEIRYGGWSRERHMRLFRRRARFSESRVHEHLLHQGEVGTLREPIVHDSYRSFGHHLRKIDTYGRWGAEDLFARGSVAGITDLTVRPAWRFLRAYIIERGMLDGRIGVILAGLSAYACFVKYAYLVELGRTGDRLRPPSPDGPHAAPRRR